MARSHVPAGTFSAGTWLLAHSSLPHEPGHLVSAANGHLITKMARHGDWDRELVAGLELPGNMAIMSVDLDRVDGQADATTDAG
jgi:hypothetical protein